MASLNNFQRIVDAVWLTGVAGWAVWPARVRTVLLRAGGVQVGRSGLLGGQKFVSGHRVEIGDGTFVNAGCLFDSAADIRIGDNVAVGPETAFITSAHQIGPSSRRSGINKPRPIAVGDGAWIGARAIVLPGVSVGHGCVIAAGSIVTRDTDPNGMYAGVPARRIRDVVEDAEFAVQ